MKKIYKKLGVLLLFLVSACNLDGDLQDPNQVSVSGADVNLILNAVQLDFADFFYAATQQVNPLIRHEAMNAGFRYQTAYQPQFEDAVWTGAYRNVLVNAETLIPLALAKGLTTHVAVAELLEAYTYVNLVDVFGDVPQSEALKGSTGNYNPKADGGAAVYAKALALIQDARDVQLAAPAATAGAALARDIYYGGSRANWTALANTLELKIQLNMSMMPANAAAANSRITALLASNIIDTEAENFTYKYGTATVPNSRHPLYNQYYGPTLAAAGGYINTGFLFELFRGKPDATSASTLADPTKFAQDPRWRYMVYRQIGSLKAMKDANPKGLGCTPAAPPNHYTGYPFCAFDPGFYGRDHGDASGTPPDAAFITCAGVYPAGGKWDSNTASLTLPATNAFNTATQRGDGANGAGILPIFMYYYTDYMRAEITARAGNSALALTQLNTGIDRSIASVRKFAIDKGQAVIVPPATVPAGEASTTNYKNAVAYQYANQAHPLDVIAKEFWIAAWGNGIEAYNLYRRTSAPRNMQPTLQTSPGPFLRSVTYPAVYVNLNSSATQKDFTTTNKVFWDTNPDVLN